MTLFQGSSTSKGVASVANNGNHVYKDIWKQMWSAALLLYVSYFFYRWVGVFIAGVIGEIADTLLYQSQTALSGKLLIELSAAFGLSLLVTPMIDMITNILVFRRGLKYELTVIRSVIEKKYETVQKWQAGEWLGRIAKDSLQYRQIAVVTPTRLVADGTVLLIAIITMIKTNLLLALLALGGLIVSTTIQLLAKKKSEHFLEETRKFQDSKRTFQVELVRGHDFLMMMGCENTFPSKMKDHFQSFRTSTQNKDYHLGASLNVIQKLVVSVVFVGSLFLSLLQVQQGKMTMGHFISTYFLSIQVQNLATSLLGNLQVMRGYKTQESRIKELLQEEASEGEEEVPKWEELHFEQLSYIYPKTQEGMPERDFSIKRNAIIHLEGANGSGKTTLLNLLCGLFSSKNDQIRVNDIPLAHIDLTQWRKKIGYMQQFPDLFPCNVRENIHISNLSASEKDVETVLAKVGLSSQADRVLLGTKKDLSGGEIKRIALARLLLRLEQCELVIMDEPMGNLDETGKEIVREIINSNNRARILVSHNSTP